MAEAAPSSGKAATSRALSTFSDLLFDIKDDLPEGKYILLCKAAQEVHDEKKAHHASALANQAGYPVYEEAHVHTDDEDMEENESYRSLNDSENANPPPMGLPQAAMPAVEHFRTMLRTLRNDMTRLRYENDGLESQLDGATLTIDRLRDRRDFYFKVSSALKTLLQKKNVTDEEMLAAYERKGIKDAVLKDREGRKRARDVDVDAINAVHEACEAEEAEEAEEQYEGVVVV